jgi:hypothetical protein
MTIKTINYAKKLKEAGIPEPQAYAQVEVFTSIIADATHEMATKQEIQHCESQLELKIDKLDFRVAGLEKRMDGFDKRMDGFDKRMDNFDTRLGSLSMAFKWGLGMGLTYLTILMTVFQFLRH